MKLFIFFDPSQDLIYLSARIFGPLGSEYAHLALDTGATYTMIRSQVLMAIGYDLDSISPHASIVTATRTEQVKALVVEKIQAIDQTLENFSIICHDLPEESGVDGVLGLNFLRHFDIEIRYSDNTISLQPIIPH